MADAEKDLLTGAPGQDTANADKADADKADADKADADKADADKADADQADADQAAASAKPKRARRGPPAKGGDPEGRVIVLLTTSRYQDGQGGVLRRGRPVSIPESRLDGLLLKGKVRVPAKGELERALATWPAVDLF